MAPPYNAVFPLNAALVIVNTPSLNRPPPKTLFPSMMLRPDMLTAVSAAMLNTWVALLPLTDSRFAPGQSIAREPEAFSIARVPPVRVIVRGVVPKTAGEKVIVSGQGPVARF